MNLTLFIGIFFLSSIATIVLILLWDWVYRKRKVEPNEFDALIRMLEMSRANARDALDQIEKEIKNI